MRGIQMHELRRDILLGRWVEVLSESLAPSDYALPADNTPAEDSCILCPGRESELPAEILSIRMPGSHRWWVRAIPSFKPMFQIEGELGRRGIGLYDRMNNIGANEILIESPEHTRRPEDLGFEQMVRVIRLYRDRNADLEKDSRIRYVLIHKNSGKNAGGILTHPVSFLMATPVIPRTVKDELDNAKQYFAYKERCVFCDIINEELRVGDRVVLESKHFIAFCPYAAPFPFQAWIIPKRHSCAFHEIEPAEVEDMGYIMMAFLKKLRKIFNEPPFNYFIHTAPNMVPRRNHWHTLGEDYHWHLEIMPRLIITSGFEWGSGFYILPTSPENAAKYLREVG